MGKVSSYKDTGLARRVRVRTPTVRPNLRNQQRVEVTIDVTVDCGKGSCMHCRASNLSRAGLMLSCDQQTVRQLIPNMLPPAPGNWIEVKTHFPVPVLPAQPVTVFAEGNIVHLRRISRDEFQVGIQFSEFEGNGFDYVDKYVARLLAEQKVLEAQTPE